MDFWLVFVNERILHVFRVTWWQWGLTKAMFRSGTLVLGRNSLPWKDTQLELVRTENELNMGYKES